MTKSQHNTHSLNDEEFPTLWVMMLGVMVAIGPLCIDMYLPALPSMAEGFRVSTDFIANSVPAYFIGLVFGQLFYGPFSDRVGRVLPVYVGMAVFIVATSICLWTDNPYVLFAARTMQALGACVTSVVTRAAIRDRMSPKQMAKAFSLMVLVMGIAPILAPFIGTVLLKFYDWHIIFWFLLVYAGINILLTKFCFKETLIEENRNHRPISHVLSQYKDLMLDTRFSLPAVGGGMLMGALFTYISSASALLMNGYGLNETQFSIIFGVNASGFIGLAQLNPFLTNRYALVKILRFGAIVQAISAMCLMFVGLTLGGQAWLPLVLACIFCCITALGLTQPCAAAIALAFQKSRAGMASALQGAFMFSVGIFGKFLLDLMPLNQVAKLGIAMSILMVLGTVLVWKIDPKLDLNKVE